MPHHTLYRDTALIDTSAVIALFDAAEPLHDLANSFFNRPERVSTWAVLNVTSHETFTRSRYQHHTQAALARYDFMRRTDFLFLEFNRSDEARARELLSSYGEHAISFHDALCAVVMERHGIYKIFTFDRDFWILGFEVLPGVTH